MGSCPKRRPADHLWIPGPDYDWCLHCMVRRPDPPQGPYEGSQRRLCDIPISEYPQLIEWLQEGLECLSEETKEND